MLTACIMSFETNKFGQIKDRGRMESKIIDFECPELECLLKEEKGIEKDVSYIYIKERSGIDLTEFSLHDKNSHV